MGSAFPWITTEHHPREFLLHLHKDKYIHNFHTNRCFRRSTSVHIRRSFANRICYHISAISSTVWTRLNVVHTLTLGTIKKCWPAPHSSVSDISIGTCVHTVWLKGLILLLISLGKWGFHDNIRVWPHYAKRVRTLSLFQDLVWTQPNRFFLDYI